MRRKRIGGATPHELACGIGFRIAPPGSPFWDLDPWASRHTEARREMSKLRHWVFMEQGYRASFAPFTLGMHPGTVQSVGQSPVRVGDRWYVAAWDEEVRHGCPAWNADVFDRLASWLADVSAESAGAVLAEGGST